MYQEPDIAPSSALDAPFSVTLPTGTLHLSRRSGPAIGSLCDFAARANPRRGFLIVSRVLGRHLPARPAAIRAAMAALAGQLPADLSQPVVFLGMAETATALGQGVFAAWQAAHPGAAGLYLQTARQRVRGARVIAAFEEGHSHATSHLVQVADAQTEALARAARTLVIIDDEASTGNTFVAAGEALAAIMPGLSRICACSITDWSGGEWTARMPRPTQALSTLAGTMRWEPAAAAAVPAALPPASNAPGAAPDAGMGARTGLLAPERALRAPVAAQAGERVLVLGDGEHTYEALLIAEELERGGAIAAVQSITRSPVLPGLAMASVTRFDDAYGSGAPCFLYNMLGHAPGRIVIAAEIAGGQARQAAAGLAALGSAIPVETVLCRYAREGAR